MKRNLLADPNAPYKAFCDSLTPGKTVTQDMTKSMDLSALLSGAASAPTIASFSAAFYHAVYNYYAKQLSQPVLTANEKSSLQTNQHLVEAIARLMENANHAHSKNDKSISHISDLPGNNLIIGEITHNSVAPKKFLIQNMQALKDAGCDTLYIEHFPYDVMQSSFDKLNRSGEMDSKIKTRLVSYDRGYGHFPAYNPDDMSTNAAHREQFQEEWNQFNFSAVVKAAHNAGLRVVAIDIKDIYETQSKDKISGQNKLDRVICGDYSFANIIQHDQNTRQNKGSWVALIGAAHVPGLERLIQQDVTTVLVGDRKEKVVEVNCRAKDIPISSKPHSALLPKSDLVIALPLGDEVPSMKQELRSSRQSKL